MKLDLDIHAHSPTEWATRAACAALFAAIAMVLIGLTVNVEYRWAKVLDIQQRAGRDMISRVVLVDTPNRSRLLVTSDPYLRLEKGAFTCVSKRKLISRRFLRYSLELPGYCRTQRRPDAAPLHALPKRG